MFVEKTPAQTQEHILPLPVRREPASLCGAGSTSKQGDHIMQVSQIMTRDPEIASPDDTLQEVAQRMLQKDIGFLPVGENDQLVGMVTDRDIVVRGVAAGMAGDSKIREVMTTDIKYCLDSDAIDDVVVNMGEIQVRRLAVIDKDKRLCGIVSLADTAEQATGETGSGLRNVVRPGGDHNQAAS